MRPLVFLTLVAASLVVPAGAAQSPPETVTVQEAVDAALRTSPLVQAAEARVRAGRFRLTGARAPLNPEAIIQHGFGNGTGGLDEDISISQTLELFGKRGYRTAAARQDLSRAQAELEAARIEAAFQARTAYLALQDATANADNARQFLELAQKFQSTANTLFMAGEVPRTQVIRSGIEVSARQLTLDEATANLETAGMALNSAMGRPLSSPVAVPGAIPDPAAAGTLETWRQAARARPEVVAARAELASRQAELNVARAERTPNAFVTATHADLTDWTGNSIRVGFIFPLWDRGVLRARVDEARAGIAEQQFLLGEAMRSAELEITTAYTQATRAAERLQRYRTGQLDQARNLTELAQIGYEAGHTDFLELLDAQRSYFEAQAGSLKALADAARARLSLERAAGSPSMLSPLSSSPPAVGTPR